MKQASAQSHLLGMVSRTPRVLILLCLPPSVHGLAAQSAAALSRHRPHADAARETLVDAGGRWSGAHLAEPSRRDPSEARAAPKQPGTREDSSLALLERDGRARGGLNLTGSMDCIDNNGGSCLVQSCYSWRGSQTCHLGRCFCTAGQCAGTDGMCHDEHNVVIANAVRFRNVRFPDYFLYISNFNYDLWVDRNPGNQGDFNLWQLPNGGHASDPPDFLIASTRFQGYVVNVREKKSCDSNNDCTTKIMAGTEHVVFPMDKGIQHLAMEFERIPERPDAVMIASYMYSRMHLYVSVASWQVGTYDGDPGTGGYWTFDPPLSNETMERLRMYHGPRCTWFCGLSSALGVSRTVLLLVALSLLSSSTG
mmetsp:Transcript_105265/g.280256  ORF Transcript_105265/g.280256 Transcript_105265/m.280256 type:complete len:366 (-) Transcript_105265:42-1139(-)